MQDKIKVCFFVSSLDQGGAEKQLVELIKNIDKSIFDVNVCVYSRKEVFYKDILNTPGVIIYTRNWYFRSRVLRLFELIVFIRKYFTNKKFDIVQTTLRHNGVYLRLFISSKYNNKVITSIRSRFNRYTGYKLFLEQILIKNSHVVINSKKSTDEFLEKIPEKYHNRVHHINNGINFNRFVELKSNQNKNKIIIGLVGRNSNEKNFMQIIRILPLLPTNFSVKIIGSKGNASQEIESYIEVNDLAKRIEIYAPIQDIENFYSSINTLIITSFYEGSPNVLFEALFSKRLCIINSMANTDNYIINGINGFIYDGSDEDLLKTIISIQNINDDEYNEIINNGYNYAMENFSLSTMVKNYEELYKHIYINEKN